MIALDTSAVVAIALNEPDAALFNQIISMRHALIGAPTLLEVRFVLTSRIGSRAEAFLDDLTDLSSIRTVAFSVEMFRLAASAFERYGKGRGRKAGLNFGDCMSYAVAKAHDVPLLFKGEDFTHTDIRPAFA